MDFLCYFFWNNLPNVETETRFVNGKDEVCLIVPTKINQLKKSKKGGWMSVLRLSALPINSEMLTHSASLVYNNWDEVHKARSQGYYNQTQKLGRVRMLIDEKSKKIDRRNRATDCRLSGSLFLSDIPNSCIKRSAETDNRCVSKLTMRHVNDRSHIYTGAIDIDIIPKSDIQTDSETGKKYVNMVFRKLEYLDTYMNTHQLIVARNDGSEIEIGRFKEWSKETEGQKNESANTEEHTTTVNPRPMPTDINGIKF